MLEASTDGACHYSHKARVSVSIYQFTLLLIKSVAYHQASFQSRII